MTRVEIISAIRNEVKSLPLFVEQVRALPLPEGVELHMTFVEDSSTDGTVDVLRELSSVHSEIDYYCLERGFGQGPAIIFGLSQTESDATILMDVDGGHPPEAIPRMIALHLEGARVVQCVRRTHTHRRAYRRLATWLFQRPASWLAQVDLAEQNIYYRLVNRHFAERLLAEPRYWLFLRFPLPRAPGELARVEVDIVERTHDESKYGPTRLMRLAVDAVLSLMTPVRLWTVPGVIALLAVAFVLFGAWPIALLLGATLFWTARRYRQLQSSELLTLMRVRESNLETHS